LKSSPYLAKLYFHFKNESTQKSYSDRIFIGNTWRIPTINQINNQWTIVIKFLSDMSNNYAECEIYTFSDGEYLLQPSNCFQLFTGNKDMILVLEVIKKL
jgi:hypothetical protein